MNYANLGKTGLKVSRICLGCMSYGLNEERQWGLDEQQGRPFIKQALELGINFFDTANMYGNGRSEEVLGRAVRAFAKRASLILRTTRRSVTRTAALTSRLSVHEAAE